MTTSAFQSMPMPCSETDGRVASEGAPVGAPADWDDWLRRYGRLVYSVPRRFGLTADDCDDVCQATWLTAVSRTSLPTGGEDVVVRWLAAIAAWETRNLLRRKRVRVREPGLLEEVEASPDHLPERIGQMVEEHLILQESIAALPERDRAILGDLFLTETPLSYDEVARRLGVAIGSVGPLRLRAIERLRAELVRRGF